MKSRAASRPAVERGFTLLELLLTIAIGVAIFSLTVPTMIRFYRSQIVDDTAKNMVDSLRRAHQYSIAQVDGQSYGVKLLPLSNSYVLFQGSSYALRNTVEDEVETYPSIVTIDATSTEVVFSRLHGTSTVSGTWTLSGGLTRSIIISPQGTINLQ